MIAGQFPRRNWRGNPDGQSRTIEQAVEIAKAAGIPVPDDVAFFAEESPDLSHSVTARGPRVDKYVDQRMHWSDLVHDLTGKVPFRVWPGILGSDEAIVAVIAHELYELERLRPLLRAGTLSIDDYIAHTEPGRAGNLHDQAWDEADRVVDRMRMGDAP